MKNHGLFEIHVAVFLFGLAGLFGKLLALPPLVIVFGRTFFASITMGAILVFSTIRIHLKSGKDLTVLVLLGIVLAIHWITFFYSIQLSTVAVGLLTFSTFPVFVTVMEPYFFKEKFRLFDMATAAGVVVGLVLVIPSFDLQNNLTQGAFWGLVSGFTFALLSILNRKYVSTYPSILIVCFQNLIATIILFPFMFIETFVFQPTDYLLLAVLGVFCTALAHVLFIRSLVYIKTQLAGIIACLEPVYGIIFAFLLLGEIPSPRTMLGGGIILCTIVLAILKRHPSEKTITSQ